MESQKKLEPIGNGVVVPSRFEERMPLPGPRTVFVDVTVQVVDGRAYARKLSLTPEDEEGLTSTDLRRVSLRNLIGNALLLQAQRIELVGTEARVVDVDTSQLAIVVEAVKRAVGYLREEPTRKRTTAKRRTATKKTGKRTATRRTAKKKVRVGGGSNAS